MPGGDALITYTPKGVPKGWYSHVYLTGVDTETQEVCDLRQVI